MWLEFSATLRYFNVYKEFIEFRTAAFGSKAAFISYTFINKLIGVKEETA
jgi:hypothetical protein